MLIVPPYTCLLLITGLPSSHALLPTAHMHSRWFWGTNKGPFSRSKSTSVTQKSGSIQRISHNIMYKHVRQETLKTYHNGY